MTNASGIVKPVDLGPYIVTVSGHRFYLLNPHMSRIDPVDIAHALSNLCRYTGHTHEFYSVAQHCVLVSRNVPERWAFDGLLHDAAEAYTGDLNSPLKAILDGAFSGIEAEIERAIAIKFGRQWPRDQSVKQADMRSYATEVRDITSSSVHFNGDGYEPWPEPITGWSPERARTEWMDRFVELGGVG